MSSLQRHQVPLSFESSSKKKFGKNLNKIQKPAPPITNSGTNKAGSSNNGLLLLSTKRPTSTAGNLSSSGLLASKINSTGVANKQATQSVVARSDFYTSTHEALLDVVSGVNRKDKEQQPDAWRVSDKPDQDISASTLSPRVGVTSSSEPASKEGFNDGNYDSFRRNDQPQYANRQRYDTSDGESWRRQQPLPEPPSENNSVNTTQIHMSALARERAERIRSEEEARMNEQRERASQRLRELEEKMAAVPRESHTVSSPSPSPKNGGDADGKHHTYIEDPSSFKRHEITMPRTLFDPNRTYSSLVGKSDSGMQHVGKSVSGVQQDEENKQRQLPSAVIATNDALPESSLIQLASYDDRDRGESHGKTAVTRMLFDPRSGSMVAVTNDKAKKGKQPQASPKSRNVREPLPKSDAGDLAKLAKKNGKVRKDDPPDNRKGPRGHSNSIDSSPANEVKGPKSRATKVRPAEQRLPRTCGVLYVRDPKGNAYCADGTEPEQYGSHLVRGGKIRNPAAHAAIIEEQQLESENKEGDDNYDDRMRYESYNNNGYGLNGNSIEFLAPALEKVELVKGDDKFELLTDAPESPTLKATAMEWAPSKTAMAAAAAAKDKFHSQASVDSVASGSVGFLSEDDSDDGLDPTSYVGLGFNPTENMDSVMASPSSHPLADVAYDIDFTPLSIDAVNPSAVGSSPHNYFAFGLSGTWGTGGGAPLTGSTGNWGTMLVSGNDKATDPAPSFLSLSSNNTWGSGFGGLSGSNTTGD